jgi:hypothetical protein
VQGRKKEQWPYLSIYIGDVDGVFDTLTDKWAKLPERVVIPIFHTGIYARSGMGKTWLIQYMIEQAAKQGYHIIIFDSKVSGPQFEDFGTEIPLYISQPLDEKEIDPDAFQSLIEKMNTEKKVDMRRYRYGFIALCRNARTLQDVRINLDGKLKDTKTIKGSTRFMYEEIEHDLRKLEKMMGKYEFSDDVYYQRASITRMATWKLPNVGLQGLVVRSVIRRLFEMAKKSNSKTKVILLIDEAPNFVSQSEYNPAKPALQDVDEQGRDKEIWGWYTAQNLTGFDKKNMKNLQEWILGGQMERNEKKATYDTETDKIVSVEDVAKLKVRMFIVSTPDWSKLVKVPDLGKAGLRVAEVSNELGEGEHGGLTPLQVTHAKALRGSDSAADVQRPGWGSHDLPLSHERHVSEPAPRSQATLPLTQETFEKLHDHVQKDMDDIIKETKSAGNFTLQVTRLVSDSLDSKLLFLIKRNGSLRQAEMIAKAAEYGWTLDKGSVSKSVNSLLSQGLLVGPDTNHRYRFPSDESFKVEEVRPE